jgi:acetate kinase
VDVLAFTGGVGERSAMVRERAAAGWVSWASPSTATATRPSATTPTSAPPGATARTLVITAREDLQITREARQLLGIRSPR